MTGEIDSRAERTLLISIIDDLKERLKVAKEKTPYTTEAYFIEKEIKRYKSRLLKMQRAVTRVAAHIHTVDNLTAPQ